MEGHTQGHIKRNNETFYFVYPKPAIFVPDTQKSPFSWLIHLRYVTKNSLKNKEKTLDYIGRFLAMDHFELVSEYQPTGDQPQAIEQLVKGFKEGNQCQTLLGVTGSGKTFTMANVIAQLNKPTLIIAHNKTLAAQLYGEFKEFFPNNAVDYFVSY